MTLKLNGSTNGSVSIDAPADTSPSGTDVTLTLPTSAGSSGQYLQTNGSGTLSWAGAGKILQVVQGSTTTSTANNTTTYADTTLSASITPSSTSNKVLVIVSQSGQVYSDQTGTRTGSLRLLRGTTEIHEVIQALGGRGGLSTSSNISNSASVSLTYLDSPSTTSSVTYKTQAKISNSDSNYTTQISNTSSTITLLEVAG